MYFCTLKLINEQMVIVKRLHTFMLQRFMPLLAMTFVICLFIVLMQFVYQYINEMVGKGLSIKVIGELMFYAALSLVPKALPLAVLLASLMTFGNLGEKFELTALKAAGISLYNIMKPLIVLMVIIAVGAFYFQNRVLPVAQTKMWTLLFSMRQKSPEVEIPERAFYGQIPGINLYVERKNPDTGMLYDMIIYDVSKGLDNSRVILADSGKLNFTEDKTRLFMHLFRGEMFENLRDNALGSSTNKFLPFRRESFTDKQIYLMFDANFNRIDEGAMRRQYIGKNIEELKVSIDSIGAIVDSIGTRYGNDLKTRRYVDVESYKTAVTDSGTVMVRIPAVTMDRPLDIDSIFSAPSPAMKKAYITQALAKVKQARDENQFRNAVITDQSRLMHRHGIEMHQKFTLSIACLIFFFIGAPLGAIIKKGGIGTPLVVSVILFIIYYIIDNTGMKMARDGKIGVWQGTWLSSMVLLPLGIFFTYKAVGDSAVFNIDAYKELVMKLFGKMPKRSLEPKEVIIQEVSTDEALDMLQRFDTHASAQATTRRSRLDKLLGRPSLTLLEEEMNTLIDYLSNSRQKIVVALLNEYPFRLNHKNLANVISNTRLISEKIRQHTSLTDNSEDTSSAG